MITTVSDLDSLVLRVRNKRARSYIAESVTCLKAGAFRAAIVVAWIAVVHDLIGKFDELALGGDANAAAKTKAFTKLVEDNDITASLAFEKTILEDAYKEFELFGPQAFEDLKRLRLDRHRCAHPSMVDGDSDYQPPPELARYHVVSAVTHLLEHGPAQGKAAIERVQAELEKQYFPDTVEKTVVHLNQGPLRHPRDALVRNFVIALLKRYFEKDTSDELPDGMELARFIAARERFTHRALLVLGALLRMHRERMVNVLSEKLDVLVAHFPDDQRFDVLQMLLALPEVWTFLSEAQRNRLVAYVENLPRSRNQLGPAMSAAWKIPGLRAAGLHRLSIIGSWNGWAELASEPGPVPVEWIDAAIEQLGRANSWSSANAPAGLLNTFADQLSEVQIRRICEVIQGDDDRKTAFEVQNTFGRLVSRPGFGLERVKQMLSAAGSVDAFERLSWWNPQDDD